MSKCPECGSTDINEEDDMLMNLIILGAPLILNTSYVCNNCGCEWED